MKPNLAYQLFKQLMWYAVVFSAPSLLATLLVGGLIGAPQLGAPGQAMPQPPNPTLIMAVAALLALGPWLHKRRVAALSTPNSPIPQSF